MVWLKTEIARKTYSLLVTRSYLVILNIGPSSTEVFMCLAFKSGWNEVSEVLSAVGMQRTLGSARTNFIVHAESSIKNI